MDTKKQTPKMPNLNDNKLPVTVKHPILKPHL